MKAYIGVGDKAKAASKMYVGVGGTAKKVVRAYVGDEGCRARLFFDDSTPVPPPTPPEPTYVTFAGRKVYRHATLPGSVVDYNEFGTSKKLFVADAAYRGTAKLRTTTASVSGLTSWVHFYYPVRSVNAIDNEVGITNLSKVSSLSPYESKLTDAYFQSALAATLKAVLQTAKAATDFMIAAGSCPAAQFCRSKSIGIQLQLPNIYQLLVMYAMGDVIDSLDPTVGANPKFALGWNGGKNSGYRWYAGGGYHGTWSSTGRGNSHGNTVSDSGGMNFDPTNYDRGVYPVAEL